MSLGLSLLVLAMAGTNAFLHVTDMPDFANSIDDYTFVFHNDHNLLLVLRGDNCYFFPVLPGVEWLGLNDYTRNVTEIYMKNVIEHNVHNIVVPSTEQHMRDVFGDVLADFRCNHHNIFYINLDPSTLSTPKPGSGGWDPSAFFNYLAQHRPHSGSG